LLMSFVAAQTTITSFVDIPSSIFVPNTSLVVSLCMSTGRQI
jgi:hypothetical protein